MENATKALIISAGVLIGIIILSMAVYLFGVFGKSASDMQEQILANQLNQFNDKFLRYTGLTDLTIQDVITVKNYALENNKETRNYNPSLDEYRAADNNEYIDVYYKNNSESEKLIYGKTDEELLKEAMDKKYTCRVLINPNTKKVNQIYFYEI